MTWKSFVPTWRSERLYILLVISIIVFVAVYLVPDPPGYAPPPTATPLPTPLLPLTRLTKDEARDLAPVWSPDGEHIAFQRSHHQVGPVYIMRADGSDLTRLTQSRCMTLDITWSPDGERIAYVSGGAIYTVSADGSRLAQLTEEVDIIRAIHRELTWSPDGRAIAFILDYDGVPDLYIVTIDDGKVTRLTKNHAWTQHPTWSPDSRVIAFHSTRAGTVAIYTLDLACVEKCKQDTPCLTRLTDTTSGNLEPTWSPDGTRIAFTSLRDGNPEIYVMDADGSRQTRLTRSSGVDRLPTWSPDGAHIAFLSSPDLRQVHNDIYVIRPDGSDLRQLTNDGLVRSIAWAPDGRQIAFVSLRDNPQPRRCSSCNTEIYTVAVSK